MKLRNIKHVLLLLSTFLAKRIIWQNQNRFNWEVAVGMRTWLVFWDVVEELAS